MAKKQKKAKVKAKVKAKAKLDETFSGEDTFTVEADNDDADDDADDADDAENTGFRIVTHEERRKRTMRTIGVSCPIEFYSKVRNAAKRHGIGMAEFTRQCLAYCLEQLGVKG